MTSTVGQAASAHWLRRSDELCAVDAFLGRFLGQTGRPELVTLARRAQAHGRVIRCLRDARGSIVASFVLYPLTAAAVGAIVEGRLLSGRDIADDDLVPSGAAPAGWYVAAAAATIGYSNALLRDLAQQTSAQPAPLFARAATEKGHRLMRRTGFDRIGGESEIWMRPEG